MCSDHSHIPIRDYRRYRHRWEMPMIWLSVLITVGALCFAMGVVWIDSYGVLDSAMPPDEATSLRDTAWGVLYLLPLAPLVFYVYRFFIAAQARSNAILVGPRQFPDLFALYQDLGVRMDMARLPKFYVTNGNGAVNAFALECNRRHNYIVMNAEIAMMLPQARDIVAFVLAHEMAHHKMRHVSLWRLVIGIVPNTMLLPGRTTTRAQEYSADRLALAVCPDHASAVRLLAAGPWMANGVDPDAWLAQCDAEHREFMVRVANGLSSHAVMVKRFKALRDIERRGFAAHGEMF